jgi:hypothetical protein
VSFRGDVLAYDSLVKLINVNQASRTMRWAVHPHSGLEYTTSGFFLTAQATDAMRFGSPTGVTAVSGDGELVGYKI